MKEYTYMVARIRAREAELLTEQDIEELLNTDSFEQAVRYLNDKGYGNQNDVDALIRGEENKMWSFLEELAQKDIIRVVRLPIDYHNIKASVKAAFSDIDGTDLLLDNGTESKDLIYKSVKSRSYAGLNAKMGETAENAMTLILRTQDGQACDIYIDKCMLSAINDAAEDTGDEFIISYAKIYADITNLKTALRCAMTERGGSFIQNAVYDGGTLNKSMLVKAAQNGTDALLEYVKTTSYAEGAELMKKSAAAFEKWCSDYIMKHMDNARYEGFTAAPIIAYAHAKRTELETVRLILLAKQNMLDNNMIRERVPKVYV